MVITDANPPYHIKHANSAWSRLTGFSAAFVKAKTMKILQGPATSKEEIGELMAAVEKRERFSTVLRNYTSARQPIRNHLEIIPLVSQFNGPVTHFLSIMDFEYEAVVKTRTTTTKLQKALLFLEASKQKVDHMDAEEQARTIPHMNARRRFSLFTRKRSRLKLSQSGRDLSKLADTDTRPASGDGPALKEFKPEFSPGDGEGKGALFQDVVRVKQGGELQLVRDHEKAFVRGGRFRQVAASNLNGNSLFESGFHWNKTEVRASSDNDTTTINSSASKKHLLANSTENDGSRSGSKSAFIAAKAPKMVHSVDLDAADDEDDYLGLKMRSLLARGDSTLQLTAPVGAADVSSHADGGAMSASMLSSTPSPGDLSPVRSKQPTKSLPRTDSAGTRFQLGRGGSISFLQYPKDRSLTPA